MPSNLRHYHPRMNTLIRWHSYANLTRIRWRYTGRAKINFLRQGFSTVIVLQPANACI